MPLIIKRGDLSSTIGKMCSLQMTEQSFRENCRKEFNVAEASKDKTAEILLSAVGVGMSEKEMLQIAVDEIGTYLTHSDIKVDLILSNDWKIEPITDGIGTVSFGKARKKTGFRGKATLNEANDVCLAAFDTKEDINGAPNIELEEKDESFTQMLLRLIDRKGMTDADCYRKANMSRQHFSKIRSDVYYQPKKATVLALAVALELNLQETEELLRKAGYAFSDVYPADIVLKKCIEQSFYNIHEINLILFSHNLPLLD